MQKPNIYITRKFDESIIAPYRKHFTIRMWDEEFIPVAQDVLYKEAIWADGVLSLLTDKIDKAFLAHANHLKIIANMAVGYDNIDIFEAKKQNIIVTNTPEVLTETTADLTFALLMATARRLLEANKLIYENKWGVWSPFQLVGTDIYGKTIGIVGMGRIGSAVARRAKGFGMKIIYHNRKPNEKVENEVGATYVSFEQLLEQADFIVSLLPLTDETTDTFNEQAFKRMKRSAIFINVSRGGVVDETALFHALINNEIAACGLDVFKNEPIDTTHPLTTLDNVVLLPHIGSATKETRENMVTLCLDNIYETFYGKGPLTPVTNE